MPSVIMKIIYAKFVPKNPKDVAKNQADVSIILLKIKDRLWSDNNYKSRVLKSPEKLAPLCMVI